MTANKIKEAALILFAQKGYEGTALSEIAKIVGIKTPSIYAHFSSKEELFFSIYRDLVSMEYEEIRKIASEMQALTVKEQLESIFYELTNPAHKKSEKLFFKRAIFFPPRDMEINLKKEFTNFELKSAEQLIQLFDKGKRNSEIRPLSSEDLVASFYCMIDGLLIESDYYESAVFQKRRHSVWKVFWQGISVEEN